MGRKASWSALRHCLEALQVARDIVPWRLFADKDRDLRLEPRRLVERAGVEVDHPRHHLGGAVHHAQADRTGVATRRFAAAADPRVGPRLAFQRHRAFGKAQPADMAGAAGALAAAAMAEALHQRLALGPITQRAASTSTLEHGATMTSPAAKANGAAG